MRIRGVILSTILVAALPVASHAQDRGFFVGVDVLGGVASGSSDTRNGGGILPMFEGDGVVDEIRFENTIGIGGHIGYRFKPSWSAIISYQHFRDGVSWEATFPTHGGGSSFDGEATSDVVVANLAYTRPLSDATSASIRVGVGVAFNGLSDLVETDKATGIFVSDVAEHRKASATIPIGLGIQRTLTSSMSIGLDAAYAYAGGFATGDTRTGNLGVTSINPYEINSVWRGTLGASLRVMF